jgi:hypothetical protein
MEEGGKDAKKPSEGAATSAAMAKLEVREKPKKGARVCLFDKFTFASLHCAASNVLMGAFIRWEIPGRLCLLRHSHVNESNEDLTVLQTCQACAEHWMGCHPLDNHGQAVHTARSRC